MKLSQALIAALLSVPFSPAASAVHPVRPSVNEGPFLRAAAGDDGAAVSDAPDEEEDRPTVLPTATAPAAPTPLYDVVIVGGGAAGLSAARELTDRGRRFVILEADSATLGGRTLRSDELGYPVDLGAQWIHTNEGDGKSENDYEGLPGKLLDNIEPGSFQKVTDNEVLEPGAFDRFVIENNGTEVSFGRLEGIPEYFWTGYTWGTYVEEQVKPKNLPADAFELGCVVNLIDTNVEHVVTVECANGKSFQARHVIATVSVQILKDSVGRRPVDTRAATINFSPQLSRRFRQALDRFVMGQGAKVWLEFSSNFFPNEFEKESIWETYGDSGYLSFYNDAARHDPNKHVVLMLAYDNMRDSSAVGPYEDLFKGKTDDQVIAQMLSLLVEMFPETDVEAEFTGNSIVKNWGDNPYTRGAWKETVVTDEVPARRTIAQMLKPAGKFGQILFAGESFSPVLDRDSNVQFAIASGRFQADKLVNELAKP